MRQVAMEMKDESYSRARNVRITLKGADTVAICLAWISEVVIDRSAICKMPVTITGPVIPRKRAERATRHFGHQIVDRVQN
jgi:hypothetical protein